MHKTLVCIAAYIAKCFFETFARVLFNPKTYQSRHSRVGGNPVSLLIRLDSRLRGNDGNWGFYIKLQSICFVQRSLLDIFL